MGVSHTGPVFRGPAFEPPSEGDPAVVSGHRITARLGTGSLGRVYYANAPGGQPVALTVIRPELAERPDFTARFHRDAQAAGRVRSPWAVPVTGSGKEGPRFWIASAYVPSLSLHAAVSGGGPLPTGVVLRLVAGIARGLQDIHHAGVVHGDLRPAHVLLAADAPRVKDYGIVRTSDAALLTGTAAANGSPVFRSPEQAAGRPSVPATDVFALGQLAAYASIGSAPFGDGPAHTVLPRVQQEEPDLSELPGELREIVTRCLIKDPALRPSPAQIIAMCGQAAPESTRPRTDPWLPPALMAAIVPAMPGAPPGSGGVAGGAEAAAAPGTAGAAGALGAPGAVTGTGVPGVPGALPHPGAAGPGPAPGYAAAPAVPPTAGAGAPPAHPPGFPWHPQSWPRPAHLHLPLPRRRPRRTAGTLLTAAGLAVAVTAGIALAGGFDDGGRVDGAGRPLAAGASASASPDASGPPAGGTPTGGFGEPPSTGTDDGDTAGESDPALSGTSYADLRLPAGYSLSLQEDPPRLRPGALGGSLGFTDRADAFTVDPDRGILSLLAPGRPASAAGCRSSGPQETTLPRRMIADGTRMCLWMTDGSFALVTFRQLTPPGEPDAAAVLDVTVWRPGGPSTEGNQ